MGNSEAVVPKLKQAPESPGGLVKFKALNPTPRLSDSMGFEWG